MELQNEHIILNGSGITLAINPKEYTANFDFAEVSPANYEPKEGEFIEIPARALSNVIVAPNTYRATEFPAEVLKAGMGFLVNKNFFSDHMDYTEHSKGLVISSDWQDSYVQDNKIIPAGINVVLRIDTVSEPKLARKILSGEIAAVSVGVEFTWLPSHAFEYIGDFYEKIGTIGDDGKMVRRIANEIKQFREISIVPIGADPFACIIKEGELSRIDKARADKAMLSMFSDKDTYEPKKAGETGEKSEIIGALQVETLNFALHEKDRRKKEQIDNDMNKEFLKLLGIKETATFEEAKAEIEAANGKLTAIKSEVETLKSQLNDTIEREKGAIVAKTSAEALLQDAKDSVARLESFAAKYNAEIEERKERIKAAYQATNNVSSVFLALIDNAADTQLSDLEKEVGVGLAQNLGLCCGKCGHETFVSKRVHTTDPNIAGEGEERGQITLKENKAKTGLGF